MRTLFSELSISFRPITFPAEGKYVGRTRLSLPLNEMHFSASYAFLPALSVPPCPAICSLPGKKRKKKLHCSWKSKSQEDYGTFSREIFYLQSFRGALPIFSPSVALSAVMWVELDVCSHTTIIQRDTASTLEHVLMSF